MLEIEFNSWAHHSNAENPSHHHLAKQKKLASIHIKFDTGCINTGKNLVETNQNNATMHSKEQQTLASRQWSTTAWGWFNETLAMLEIMLLYHTFANSCQSLAGRTRVLPVVMYIHLDSVFC